MNWGTSVELERRNRIQLSIAAYAYEIMDDPLVSDAAFDAAAFAIKPEMETGQPILDKFFREEFSPSTGMWIRKHPELTALMARYRFIKEHIT